MRVMPSEISGEICAPPSKSMMQRVVALAALADGQTTITNPSFCNDSLAAIGIVKGLGAIAQTETEKVSIEGTTTEPPSNELYCNESGLCMRMFSPIAALFSREMTITGSGSLLSRPIGMIEKPLRELGAKVETNGGLPPVKIKGPMLGGIVTVDGSISSQFISGLVMALPLCKNDSEVEMLNLKSKDYVEMTKQAVEGFGGEVEEDEEKLFMRGGQKYSARDFRIEGDWSGAAFMLVAGAIAGEVNIDGLESSAQPDQEIKTVLMDVGAEVILDTDEIFVSKSELNGFEFDATHSPDLFPPLVALACNCKGKSTIIGVERLVNKESNRALALVDEFTKIGADIRINGNRMEIEGRKLRGGTVSSHGDHRIAMACAIAALTSEKGVKIINHECVSKSYPRFFEDLNKLTKGRAGVENDE